MFEFDPKELISISERGVNVSNFNDICDDLSKLYKSIYGVDIDLSNASADGQWLNNMANIIRNVGDIVQTGVNSLNPQNASGAMLDVIASLSNTKRRSASPSKASVWIKNISGLTVSDVEEVVLVDKNAVNWVWSSNDENQSTFTLPDGDKKCLVFTCSEKGAYEALGTGIPYNASTSWAQSDNGFIYQALEQGVYQTYQDKDATVGYDEESDESLRTRISMSSSPQSISMDSGLKSALLSISGIRDVSVFNNTIEDDFEMTDNTVVDLHNVYVCIRYDEDVKDDGTAVVLDSTVGNILNNKMTPGILYQPIVTDSADPSDDTLCGVQGEYSFTQFQNIIYKVYWKKCTPEPFSTASDISLEFTVVPSTYTYRTNVQSNYATPSVAESSTEKAIANALVNYMNNLGLEETLTSTNLLAVGQSVDPRKNGNPTFFGKTGTVFGGSTFVPHNTYFHIDSSNIKFAYNSGLTTCTVTIGTP